MSGGGENIHTCMHTYVHTYIPTCMHAYTCAHIHTYKDRWWPRDLPHFHRGAGREVHDQDWNHDHDRDGAAGLSIYSMYIYIYIVYIYIFSIYIYVLRPLRHLEDFKYMEHFHGGLAKATPLRMDSHLFYTAGRPGNNRWPSAGCLTDNVFQVE